MQLTHSNCNDVFRELLQGDVFITCDDPFLGVTLFDTDV